VARAWRRYGVKPWRRETFKFSTDPELEAKVRDVVGLYVNPPTNAIVLCVDEKSQIQALNRTQPILPVRPGLPPPVYRRYRRTSPIPRSGCRTMHTHILRRLRRQGVEGVSRRGRGSLQGYPGLSPGIYCRTCHQLVPGFRTHGREGRNLRAQEKRGHTRAAEVAVSPAERAMVVEKSARVLQRLER